MTRNPGTAILSNPYLEESVESCLVVREVDLLDEPLPALVAPVRRLLLLVPGVGITIGISEL